jgi:4-amino-4-deoxy-L-arabinose transferase-like glycosyltransferase
VNYIKKLFWISLAVKLVLSGLLPLTSDEAYYWVWSRHLQLSYYDHPPFVAWLFWIGDFFRFLPGSVRWPAVLLGHATLAVWLRLLEPFLSEIQRRQFLWLMLLSPLVGGSALVVTPDLPLMFFYALSVAMYFKWIEKPDAKSSALFGLAMGLGLSSKYMMVLLPLSLSPLILFSRPVRSMIWKWWLMIVLGALVGSSPVWIWNIMNDFASIKFQTAHGLGRKVWKPNWTVEYVLSQIGLIFPMVLYWAVRTRRMPWVFHFMAWIPLAFFFTTTFRGYVEANWPIVAYPAIFALAVSMVPAANYSLRLTEVLWGTLLAALAVLILAQPPWTKNMKFREFNQFDRLVEVSKPFEPLFARSYQMAAKLHFEQRRPVFKLHGMNRKDFYDYLRESDPLPGTYYLAVEKGDVLPIQYSSNGHKVVEVIPVDDRFEIWKIEAP